MIVSRPGRNYTVNDYQQFFKDLNFEIGYEIYKDTKDLVHDLVPPNVEVHTLYGINVPTGEKFIYQSDKDFPDSQPIAVLGNGDGTVNYRSMVGFKKWIGEQSQLVKYQEIDGVDHTKILNHPAVLSYIFDLLKN